jgi:hypothetical protein
MGCSVCGFLSTGLGGYLRQNGFVLQTPVSSFLRWHQDLRLWQNGFVPGKRWDLRSQENAGISDFVKHRLFLERHWAQELSRSQWGSRLTGIGLSLGDSDRVQLRFVSGCRSFVLFLL